MGNENLKDYDSEKENEEYKINEVRYPKRMKDIKEIKGKGNKETTTSISSSDTEDENLENTQFIFVWKEGGKKVNLTGDFFNWTKFIEMKKDKKTNYFKLKLSLPKKVHEFKFIVDGQWKCSNDYKQITNDNGVFNMINLTHSDLEKKQTKKKKKNKKVDINYNCYRPKKTEMNVDAPDAPKYFNYYNIDYNTRQNKIGNKKLLIYKEKNLLSENNSYKKILTAPHINLSHCCTALKNDFKTNIKTSVTLRFKHKFVTFVYYKPEFM